jgi:hypothetical protein
MKPNALEKGSGFIPPAFLSSPATTGPDLIVPVRETDSLPPGKPDFLQPHTARRVDLSWPLRLVHRTFLVIRIFNILLFIEAS